VIFDSWQGVGRVILVGTLAYLALLVILRMSGKRTLTKMNAFDLVVTVALGSTLATIVLSKDVALVEGVVAFALLIALQFVVTWLSVRSQRVRQLVKSEPTLLFYRGQMLEETLYEQRVTEEEVRAAIRAEGKGQLAEVEAVILETDGSFSVLGNEGQAATSARKDVPGYPVKRKLSA
jgi:uncharacterized membrane protein YcaP (DUF421 family)